MRRLVLTATAVVGLAAAAMFVVKEASAAAIPVVNSIVEGRQGGTGKTEIVVIGNNLTGVSNYNMADKAGTLVGQLVLGIKTKNLLVLGLPDGVAPGTYTLRLFYGKGSSGEISFDITVTNLQVAPSSVLAVSLDPALRADLDDSTTLGGQAASYYTDAANLTGTISPARFSAFGDLVTELKIGTSATQVAAGDHLHDSRYLSRLGDSVSGVAYSFASTTGTAVAGSTAAAANYGLSGSNSASGGVGALGAASSAAGAATGVMGTTASGAGFGVRGDNTAAAGLGVGVVGNTASSAGVGVLGSATAAGASATAVGVDGTSASGIGFGVRGTCTSSSGGAGVYGTQSSASGGAYGVLGNSNSVGGVGVFAQGQGVALQVSAGTTAILASTSAAANATNAIAVFQQAGTNKARIDTQGKGYFNGGTATAGADFAESVATTLPIRRYEPGDVMVIDVKGTRRFDLSSSANSKLVAGVYATKPGVLARNGDVAGDEKWAETEVPMAIVGIVPCKVCDENGAIEAGDLLVTSSTPGHAMKASENPRAGTVVGKALANLDGKSGKIEILLIGR